MKTLIYILIILVVLVGGFYAFNTYIFNKKQVSEKPVNEKPTTTTTTIDLASYFQERIVALGIKDIGIPIEGFDDQIFISVFPGLVPSDFEGVKTLEGHYEFFNNESVFVRDVSQPISTAERTIANEGYVMLLENVSARLSYSIASKADVDNLIERINTK